MFAAYTSIIISLGICVVLPVLIVWLIMRKQTNDTNKRTEIILAALEKNPNLQIEEFIKQLNPPKKSLKKGLLEKLLCACLFIAIGISFLGVALWIDFKGGSDKDIYQIYFISIASLGIGISFLIVYFISKRMLAKELESEEKEQK